MLSHPAWPGPCTPAPHPHWAGPRGPASQPWTLKIRSQIPPAWPPIPPAQWLRGLRRPSALYWPQGLCSGRSLCHSPAAAPLSSAPFAPADSLSVLWFYLPHAPSPPTGMRAHLPPSGSLVPRTGPRPPAGAPQTALGPAAASRREHSALSPTGQPPSPQANTHSRPHDKNPPGKRRATLAGPFPPASRGRARSLHAPPTRRLLPRGAGQAGSRNGGRSILPAWVLHVRGGWVGGAHVAAVSAHDLASPLPVAPPLPPAAPGRPPTPAAPPRPCRLTW